MTGVPHSHCSYCGTAYPETAGWPRVCAACGETTWRNPLPVAVAIQPVLTDDGGIGVVVQRRDIEPKRGELALPGGFIEYGEQWRAALVRELREETGLTGEPAEVSLFAVHSAPTGTVLIFGTLPPRPAAGLPPSAPTAEATEWLVVTEPTELAFSTHTEVLADYLTRHAQG